MRCTKCAFAICSALLGVAAMAGQPRVSFDSLSERGMALIPGESPDFEALLSSSIEPDAIGSIRAILPYTVIVRNDTSEWLIAVTVRFELTDRNGRTVWHLMRFMTRQNVRRQMVPPAGAVFMTPLPGMNTLLGQGKKLALSSIDLARHLTPLAQLYSGQSRVSITLDSVVFENGELIGPDRGHTLETLNERRRAEEQLAAELSVRHGAEIRSYLASIPPADAPTLDQMDQFKDHQHSIASLLAVHLGTIKAESQEEEARKWLKAMMQAPLPILRRRDP